jgi:hypothetical protein
MKLNITWPEYFLAVEDPTTEMPNLIITVYETEATVQTKISL